MNNFTQIENEFETLELTNEWFDLYEKLSQTSREIHKNLTSNHSRNSMNLKYNRYSNIFAYDHSRVKLKNAQNTDYINANFVENKYTNRKYILAQGPLKNTLEHFWQMIWEQNSKGIVMLNNYYEKGACKCEVYVPNTDDVNSDMTLNIGKFSLNYSSEVPYEDYSIKTIEVENLEQKETRTIFHFHFYEWPDFGEPEQTTSFLNFLNECKKKDIFNLEKYGPPIVHCSAGIGRSGTFILVDSIIELYRLYENNMPLTVTETLIELRGYRMNLVQTPQQLRFSYRAIIDGINQLRKIKENPSFTDDGFISYNDEPNDKTAIYPVNDSDNDDRDDDKDSDDGDNDNDEDEDDDDDDDDDDEFYENEDAKKLVKRRPNTANVAASSKRFKANKQSTDHIKNLRKLQKQNQIDSSASSEFDNNQNSNIKKSKPKTINSSSHLNSNKTNRKQSKEEYKLTDSENEENDDNDSNDDNEDDEQDEQPFAKTRNIKTVITIEPRKPLVLNNYETSKKQDSESNKTEIVSEKLEQISHQRDLMNIQKSEDIESIKPIVDYNIDEKIKSSSNTLNNMQTNEATKLNIKPWNQLEVVNSKSDETESKIPNELSNLVNEDTGSRNESNIIIQRKISPQQEEEQQQEAAAAKATSSKLSNEQQNNRQSQTKTMTDREKRIAEQVKQMKQKQQRHENHQNIMKQLKPILIGGSILIGGLIIYQIYKKIF